MPMRNYYLTNWVNGMKINHTHFENSEKSLISLIEAHQESNVNPFNYGLLHKLFDDSQSSLKIKPLKTDNSNYIIQVSRCYGISAHGVLFDFDSKVLGKEVEIACNVNDFPKISGRNESIFYLTITKDSFDRILTGEPDAKEEPLRLPFVRPKYFLSIQTVKSINDISVASNSLVISRFVIQEGKLYVDDSYIPPVNTINAHEALENIFDRLLDHLNILHISMYNIIFKFNNKHHQSPLAYNIKVICERLIFPLSSKFFSIHQLYRHQTPVQFVKDINELAFTLKLAVDFLPAKEKEDLLLYLKEWNEVSPGEFDELLNNTINLKYNHSDIFTSFAIIEELLEFLSPTFKKLSELDLIGKRKADKDFVVRETNVKAKKSFRLID
jgi:hypothetical protein